MHGPKSHDPAMPAIVHSNHMSQLCHIFDPSVIANGTQNIGPADSLSLYHLMNSLPEVQLIKDAEMRATTRWLLVVVMKLCKVPSSPIANRMHATVVEMVTMVTYIDHMMQKKT